MLSVLSVHLSVSVCSSSWAVGPTDLIFGPQLTFIISGSKIKITRSRSQGQIPSRAWLLLVTGEREVHQCWGVVIEHNTQILPKVGFWTFIKLGCEILKQLDVDMSAPASAINLNYESLEVQFSPKISGEISPEVFHFTRNFTRSLLAVQISGEISHEMKNFGWNFARNFGRNFTRNFGWKNFSWSFLGEG